MDSRLEAGNTALAPAVQPQTTGGAALAIPESGFGSETWGARLDAAAKRGLDIAIGVFLLLVLAPVVMLIALAVRLDSYGPAFYLSPRVGHTGRDLLMLKFRKMHHRAVGIPLTMEGDDRLTRFGRFLARSKLDELPQLWHVVRGDMSLVGPRPETLDFVNHHAGSYDEILTVRPGMVGFSQIAFLAEGKILDSDDPLSHYVQDILPQKVKLDVMYARHRTLALDVRIVAWSLVAVVLRRQVAVSRDTGRMNLRRR